MIGKALRLSDSLSPPLISPAPASTEERYSVTLSNALRADFHVKPPNVMVLDQGAIEGSEDDHAALLGRENTSHVSRIKTPGARIIFGRLR